MKKRFNFILILNLLLLFGCKKSCDCLKSTGTISTEERSLTPINSINLKNNVDVRIHYSNEYKLSVRGGSNLLEKIETRIENGTLYIRNKNKCNWVRKFDPELRVNIWLPELSSIYLEDASSDIVFEDTIPAKNFRLDSFSSIGKYSFKLKGDIATLAIHNGAADLDALGSVGTLYLYGVGYGKLNCEQLQTFNTYTDNQGTNDFYVNALNTLEVKISGSGNIYYKGNPLNIVKKVFGSGKLIQL
jgi:hypothetical protein